MVAGRVRVDRRPRQPVHAMTRADEDLSADEKVDRLWVAMSACPPESLRWASLGWAIANAEHQLEQAKQLEADGRAALALVRPFWRTHDAATRCRVEADRKARVAADRRAS